MPISHEKYNIEKINHGGAPDTIWCAKMILRLKIDYIPTQQNVFLNLINDLGLDPTLNQNLFAIDFGDGFGIQYINNLNIDYQFRNNIKDTYNITLYSTDNKITYYPVDTYKDDIHFKVDNVVFNYNPEVKSSKNYTKRLASSIGVDPIGNGVIPHNAEDIYVVYHDTDIVFGSKIDSDELIYEIEITNPNPTIRLINPLSHPRFSWERLKHNVEISWGDGYITKLYDCYINTGRFNRFSSIVLEHKYDNVVVGQRLIIKIKSKEPLTPINCNIIKIDGSFPVDNYLVMNEKYGSEIVGLFGECAHEDYPEISYLSHNRNTITHIGANVCKNYLNTSMHSHFKDFISLIRIEDGFFDHLVKYCVDYSSCFENNISLEYKPKNLLGYINNTVIDLSNMFKNTPNLTESLQLCKSTTLENVNNIYHTSGITKLYDDFLYECEKLKYGNYMCYDANKLSTISLTQFKYSNNIEELSFAFMNTQITSPFTLVEKVKLWNINSLFRSIKTLSRMYSNMFTNMCSETNNELDMNYIFKDSGSDDGCEVSEDFYSSLRNVKSFTDIIDGIMENFKFKGHDFPSQMFNNVFHSMRSKTHTLLNPFKGASFSENYVELINKIFSGDNTKLEYIEGCFDSLQNPISYLRVNHIEDLENVKSLNRYFANTKIDCIIPEEYLKNQSQLTSAVSMFENVVYKYNHFPIDYLIRTQANEIDLSNMFKNSNIKTYKIIHWSTNKNIVVDATSIVDDNTQTVPLSHILDNRQQITNLDIPYNKSSIRYLTISNPLGTVTFEAINPTEDIEIDWGDGSLDAIGINNPTITHTYQNKGVYIITYTSSYAIIPINRTSSNFMEIKGEFPYNSIPTDKLPDLELGTPGYLDSILHIANPEYTHKFIFTPTYINPYYLKYAVNMKRCDMFASNKYYNILTVLPAGFYRNCVGLKDFSNLLNMSNRLIPDNIFPDQLVNSTYQPNKLWISKYQDNIIFRNKQIITDKIFKSYMTDDVMPFGTSLISIPFNTDQPKEFTTQINPPSYEYLGFVINQNITNLGLRRLIDSTEEIGNIKIEIYTSEVGITKEINITNDTQLDNCIGDIQLDSEIGFGYIRVYSKVALWLNDVNIITQLRGVIPKCVLLTPMSDLAPNLEWYSETLLARLENTSFRGFMANLPRLRYIHRNTFNRNIKASDFESCFENDISLLEVPDYLINSKEYDINTSRMFKGCVNIKYVYKPIDLSVRGRINIEEMFDGVKTIAYTSADIDSQVFKGLWYIGSSSLGQHNISISRPTNDLPTVAGWTTGYDLNQESFTASVYFEGSEVKNILSSTTHSADILKYSQSRIIHIPIGDILPKKTVQIEDYVEKLKFLPCIYQLNFIDEEWYMDKPIEPTITPTFHIGFGMYNENLLSIRNAFSQSTVITPINSMFLKFNTIINSMYGFARNSWIRHTDDIGRSAKLGYDYLGFAYLGAEGIRVPLEFTSFLNSDLECLCDTQDMFYSTRMNLEADTFSLGFMYPQNMNNMFGCDVNIQTERDRGIKVTTKLVQNIYNHTSDTTKASVVDQYANISSLFDGNLHNETGTLLPDRITSKAIILANGLTNLFRNSYILPRMYNVDFMNDVVMEEDNIIIDGIFENTNIEKLPNLPKGINSMKKSFKDCNHLVERIPENYIDSSKEVDATEAFAGSSVTIENKITTAKSMIVDDMLKDCISKINDTDIFESWKGSSKAITPDRRYAIDNPNVFVQTIDMYPTTNIYSLKTLTDISEADRHKPFKVDFGDGTIKEVTLDDCEHRYKESGVYTITFYLDNVDFVPYTDYGRTLSISRLPNSDCKSYKDTTFKLSTFFGGNIQMIEDDFFKNVKNLNIITHLQLCSGLFALKADPIAINDRMTSLKDLSYYYMDCNIKNINDIPTSIKKQITRMFAFAMLSHINITEDYISDFENVTEMTLFGYKSKGYITPNVLKNKPKLVSVRGLLDESACEITLEYNDYFSGAPSLRNAIMCFQGCTIREFPTNIIKNTKLWTVDRLFGMGTSEDIEFTIPEDFFPESIESTYKCFIGRKTLTDYHSKVFHNKPNLNNVTATFAETGIKHIKQHTICGGSSFLDASELFRDTHPLVIDDEVIIKWDTRRLIINNILDNVVYNKPFDQIIGKAVKYICEKNNYIYYKPQYDLKLSIDKPTTISLINTSDLQFPLDLDMHIDFGDGNAIHIDHINSMDELLDKTKHNYQLGDDYTIKVMGETVIQLEIQK